MCLQLSYYLDVLHKDGFLDARMQRFAKRIFFFFIFISPKLQNAVNAFKEVALKKNHGINYKLWW